MRTGGTPMTQETQENLDKPQNGYGTLAKDILKRSELFMVALDASEEPVSLGLP